MELRDFIVTPIVILLVYTIAWFVRPYCTDSITRKYFIPGLTVRILGALAVGFVYQFYYNGGDTFNFHSHGSRHVWEAFMDDPETGVRLLINDKTDQTGIYKYSSKIWFYQDASSFAIIRLAAIIDLFTFSTYSATAVIFATISFAGMWMFFLTFYKSYPYLHKTLAIAAFFIPSVFFWGSGLLKDTITMACLGMATFSLYQIAIQKKFSPGYIFLFMGALYLLFSIKIYILLTFLPASILWIFMKHFNRIKSLMLRLMLFPAVFTVAIFLGYLAMVRAVQDNPKYSLQAIAKTAQVTAYDIRYWTGRDAGSGYTLGELDGTWQSMIQLAPQAINVSLFRPYIWEVKNPLMLLSAMESLILLILTLYWVIKSGRFLFGILGDPTILFCFVFSITFAFAVGVSTYNFGTLSRYKIPLLPFYAVALILSYNYSNRARNAFSLDLTE